MKGAELTRANKAGLLMMVIAIVTVGGMELGRIDFVEGTISGIICAVLALVLLWE